MGFSLRADYLNRYKEIITLAVKYGGTDLMTSAGVDQSVLDAESKETQSSGKPEQFVDDLESLGPTFIKIGQMLSSRSDLLPQSYLQQLSRLQDEVAPFPFAQVEEVVTTELGMTLEKAFAEFEIEPLAAASLGQVHKARLHTGQQVAVKVQRPDIRKEILRDFEIFDGVASALDKHTRIGRRYAFGEMVNEFRKSLFRELDYRQEAQNLIKMSEKLQRYDRIIIPEPFEDFTTARVLTMEYIEGTKVKTLQDKNQKLDFEGFILATDLSKAYLDQVVVEGFFHADPHPGNVFLLGRDKLALIDFGMVSYVSPQMREELLKLMMAVSDGEGEKVAQITISMGVLLEDSDLRGFSRAIADLITRTHNATLEEMKMGHVLLELARISIKYGVRTPAQLTLLGKTMLHLDEVGRLLSPQFRPNEVVQQHSNYLMSQQMWRNLSMSNVFGSMLEVSQFTQKLPSRLNDFIDALVSHQFELKIDAVDEQLLMSNLQKIANRISVSLVLAALIIGAAMMMQIETEATLFGYPAIAMVLFLLAAAFGFALVINIFIYDIWKRS